MPDTIASTTRGRRRGAVAGALAIVCLSAGLTLGSDYAWAALSDVPENGRPAYLTLASDPYPVMFGDLSPGSLYQWQINASLAQDVSDLTLHVAREGDLVSRPDGLQVQVQLCSVAWVTTITPATCAGTTANVFGPVPASDPSLGPLTGIDTTVDTATAFDLGTLTTTRDAFILVTVSIPDTPATRADTSLMGMTATFGFALTARYDGPDAGAPTELELTGVDILATILVAMGVFALGLLLVLGTAARKRRQESSA